MIIQGLSFREVFDSRGEPTLLVELLTDSGRSSASLPSGKSRGRREAAVLPFYKAVGEPQHVLNLQIVGRKFKTLRELDKFLLRLDKTENKSRLGGNVILGIGLAFGRALALRQKTDLWEVLREEYFANERSAAEPPVIFANLINGGEHSKNNLDLQEYMVLAERGSAESRVRKLIHMYRVLGERLGKERGEDNLPLGDEDGYAPDFPDNFAPLIELERLLADHDSEGECALGLDAAADSFFKEGRYIFGGREVSTAALVETYARYFSESPRLNSIEDPFVETDAHAFKSLLDKISNRLVVGDDLTVTDPERIKKFARAGAINGVIIKPNQIGSVGEACEALKTANKLGLKAIVSHRSGETDDNFLLHFAKAGNAYGVKIGAPVNERISKYDEYLRLFGA